MSDISFFTLNALEGAEGTAVLTGVFVEILGRYHHSTHDIVLADMSVTDIAEYVRDVLGDAEADYYPAPYRRVLRGPIDAYSDETRALDWIVAVEPWTKEELDDFEVYTSCRVCGESIEYCSGHGEIGDPDGYRRLQWVYPEYAV